MPCACDRRRSKKVKREERKAQQVRDAKKDRGKEKFELRTPRGRQTFATRLEAQAAQRRLGGGTIHTL